MLTNSVMRNTEDTQRTYDPSFIARAIAAAGGPTAVGRQIGLNKQTVSAWSCRGHIPPTRCEEASRVLGIPMVELLMIAASVRKSARRSVMRGQKAKSAA